MTVNEFGIPEVLYFANRKGWNVGDIPSLDQLEDSSRRGAKYLCVMTASKNPEGMQAKINELTNYYPVVYNGMWAVIFTISR